MSTPLVRLASLDLLRGFVAVGRRMSITLAADDLCLTQSAVSRQVSVLEETLGVKLLVRGHRSIAFTPEGERLFRSADSAVQQLQDAIGAIRVAAERRPVTITASIGVTGLWLLTRLARFQQQYPDIDVRVATNNRLVDLKSEGIELAIRYCPPGDAPPGAIRLFGETVAPVAHPSLGLRSIDSADALAGQTLLDFDYRDLRRPWLQWTDWLAEAGWSHAKPRTVLRFNQHDQIIHAAVAGQGIALGRLELIAPLLADGRLVIVPTTAPGVRNTHAYWLIQSEPNPRRDVRDVAEWIRSEAAAQVSHAPGASELA